MEKPRVLSTRCEVVLVIKSRQLELQSPDTYNILANTHFHLRFRGLSTLSTAVTTMTNFKYLDMKNYIIIRVVNKSEVPLHLL